MGQRKSGCLKIKRPFKSPKGSSACSLQGKEAHLGHCQASPSQCVESGLGWGVVFEKDPSYQLQSTGLQMDNEYKIPVFWCLPKKQMGLNTDAKQPSS